MSPSISFGPAPTTPDVSGLLQQARNELNSGLLAAAGDTLAKALAVAPGNIEAIQLTGIVARREKNYPRAIACFQSILPIRPDDPSVHGQLGIALFEHGDTATAITHLRRATELAPDSAMAWCNLGEALKADARTMEALSALQHALRLDAAYTPARLSLARLQASRGQIEEAVREFREVLQHDPANEAAWFGLSNLNTMRLSADDVAHLRGLCARTDLPPASQARLGFTLAKSLEDQGHYDDAFEAFREANATQRRVAPWDAVAEHARANAILRAVQDWSPLPATDMQRGREVIFIVSMPRAGSTLVEQILVSHPEVEGANEIRDLTQVFDVEARARRPMEFPDWVPLATPADWQRMGEDYLARTAKWREHKPRFTDKNLSTWYLIGPALAMLPAARFVIVRRDPVENCLACFRQYFGAGNGFSYDLDDIASHYIDFNRFVELWLAKFPDRVLDLRYETLVAEPEPTIRRLLDFCGLPFDPACLAFHTTSRTVMSAPSAAQVRQPLRRDTARAERYGHKLDGLRARLREAGLMP